MLTWHFSDPDPVPMCGGGGEVGGQGVKEGSGSWGQWDHGLGKMRPTNWEHCLEHFLWVREINWLTVPQALNYSQDPPWIVCKIAGKPDPTCLGEETDFKLQVCGGRLAQPRNFKIPVDATSRSEGWLWGWTFDQAQWVSTKTQKETRWPASSLSIREKVWTIV